MSSTMVTNLCSVKSQFLRFHCCFWHISPEHYLCTCSISVNSLAKQGNSRVFDAILATTARAREKKKKKQKQVTTGFGNKSNQGGVLFSHLTCLHTTTFRLLSLFSVVEKISLKIWERPLSWLADVHFQLPSVAQKRCPSCLSFLITPLAAHLSFVFRVHFCHCRLDNNFVLLALRLKGTHDWNCFSLY